MTRTVSLLPMHKNVSPFLSCLARSSKKPLLILEASLKIRYFDFKERSYSIRGRKKSKKIGFFFNSRNELARPVMGTIFLV